MKLFKLKQAYPLYNKNLVPRATGELGLWERTSGNIAIRKEVTAEPGLYGLLGVAVER